MSIFSKLLVAAISVCNIASAWKTISSVEYATLQSSMQGQVILPTDDSYASELSKMNDTYLRIGR